VTSNGSTSQSKTDNSIIWSVFSVLQVFPALAAFAAVMREFAAGEPLFPLATIQRNFLTSIFSAVALLVQRDLCSMHFCACFFDRAFAHRVIADLSILSSAWVDTSAT